MIHHCDDDGFWKVSNKWKVALKGAVNGAASGFMWGGLSAGAAATKGFSVLKVGKFKPSNKPGNGYYGVKYMSRKKTKSFEFHTPHNGYGYHWKINKWNPTNNSIGLKGVKVWKLCGKKF